MSEAIETGRPARGQRRKRRSSHPEIAAQRTTSTTAKAKKPLAPAITDPVPAQTVSAYRPGPQLRRIYANQRIASDIWQLDLDWDGTPVRAGQFLHVLASCDGALPLRRPLSIADCNIDNTQLTLLYRTVGVGTRAFTRYPVGRQIDVLGPLGQGFPTDQETGLVAGVPREVLLIGGGVGIPPLYLAGKRLRERGVKVRFHLGVRDHAQLFWYERFRSLGPTEVATDDGSFGAAGTVLELPKPAAIPAAVYSCGPTPMLRAVREIWAQQTPTYLSLEERMACGTGACYACVIPAAHDPEKQYRACFDGPVFAANEVKL